MPKGKKKNKAGGPNRHKPDSNYPSEEESIADNSSVSNLSDFRIDSDEDTLIEADEDVVVDDFGDKLKEAIEGTYQKSLKVRIASLEFIKKSLCSKYISDFILDRQVTLCDVAERSLRRGRGEEQVLGAVLAALLCTQLGSQDEGEAVFRALGPVLALVLADTTALPTVRQQCATSLGLCCFITCTGAEDIESTMESLYSVFSGSLFKGNGIPPIVKPEISALHSSALMGWNLLLTVLSPPYIMSLCNTHLRKLPQLLDSSDVDLRIAAGETLAMLYELARQCRNDFEGHDIDTLCEKLRQLATDCQKFRAKKDRRQQRSSFRDILQTIESQEGLDIKVRMGDDEILYIEDWCHKRQYDAFCHVLGSGMSLHLKQNDLLRDIFDLGEPIIDLKPSPKNSKLQRHSAHLAACKARTKNLSKLRDKRADIMP